MVDVFVLVAMMNACGSDIVVGDGGGDERMTLVVLVIG